MSTEKTLTFEEVNAHVEQHLANRAAVAPGATLGAVDLCGIYKIVRPILILASQAFFIPQTWRSAITMLISVLDTMCPQGS